ncbi:ABC transporter substrate-binding protein [Dokdonia sp.]|uniref:ABC transporter substrate-binding protein n=1 Tax=Dokdonia sp. TaxID=2024995 RepID=UPI003264431A
MNAKKIIKISVILFLFIGVFFIFKLYNKQELSIPNKETIHNIDIGYSRLRISLPVFVAQEEGFFEKQGINANLKMYDTAQPLMQALIAGNIDIGGYTALPITYNGMLRSGKKLYFITAMIEDEDHRISYLLRYKEENKDSKITTVNDLKGKRIGILPTIAYKAWITEILKKNGLDPEKDVVIQQIAPAQQGQALKNGAVDALFTNDPAATSIIELGIGELLSNEVESSKYINDPFVFGSFNVSKKWANENKDIYKKLVLALDEAVNFVNNNPQRAKEHMRNYLSDTFKEHIKKYPDALYWNTTESDEILFENIAEKYLSIGIIPESLSLKGLVE